MSNHHVHPFMRGILTGHLPDLFPLDEPLRDATCARREELLEKVADDRETFCRAIGMLDTSANADLVDLLWGAWLEPGEDDYLRRTVLTTVNAWIDAKVSE